MLQAVREQAADAVGLLKLELPELPSEIPSIHFTEAQRLMAAATGEEVEGETDLSPAHERWLGEWARRTAGTDFLFVVGYPMAGGCALGLERWVARLVNAANIRETALFPRDINRLTP